MKEILKGFWEVERREKEDEQQLRHNRKRERELRNLQSFVNYNRSPMMAGTVGVQGGAS